MPVLKPRNRVVVFRLTQDEYQDLKTVSSVRGARNISDFARTELLTAIEQERRPDAELHQKLNSLESKIQHISQLLEGLTDRK